MLIREAMAPDAEWITPDVLLTEAALRMRDKNIGCLPVGENDRLVGMITDRDLRLPCGCRRSQPADHQDTGRDDQGHHLVLRRRERR